jgi:hypothetical protein
MSGKRIRPEPHQQQSHAAPASTSSASSPIAASTSADDATAIASLPSSKRRRVKGGQTTDDRQQTEDEETKSLETSESHEERKLSDDRSVSGASSAAGHAAAASAKPKSDKGGKAASPFARCDLDSLSIVLSMLSSDDFLSALRSNKQFYAARLKKSAWPTLQVDSFIQSLRDDDYDNPARRRLRLRIPCYQPSRHTALLASRIAVFRSMAQAGWRFVTDVQLYNTNKGRFTNKQTASVDLVLPELTQLPCLTAVNLHSVSVSLAAFEQFCIAVAPRLQVFLFKSARLAGAVDHLKHVGLLHELRVLVADQFPPLPALLQLHQLEYLHVNNRPATVNEQKSAELAATLRHLSSSHALRSLSLRDEYFDEAWILDVWLAMAPPAVLSAEHAALVGWSQPIHLTDLSLAGQSNNELMRRCAAIPTLTRLQACTGESRWDPTPLPPLSVFTHLQQLRLEFHDAAWLPHLAECNQLRVLQLLFRARGSISAESLCAIVSANAATLEELRFCFNLNGSSLPSAFSEGDAGAANWCALAKCERLRVLELPLTCSVRLSSYLLRALAKARAFQSLVLALLVPPSQCQPQLTLLRSALTSVSWCSVRLFFSAETTDEYLLSSAAHVAHLLPPSTPEQLAVIQPPAHLSAALHRLRVFGTCASHSSERCFVLRMTKDGASPKWQREY